MSPRAAESDEILMDDVKAVSEKLTHEAEERRIPLVLRPWIACYRAVPRVHVPLTSFDVSFILASCTVLSALRLAMEALLPALGWPDGGHKLTVDAAASCVSGVQAICLCAGLAACLFSQPYRPSARMDEAPAWWRDGATALIDFCTGYMMYDSLFLVGKAWMAGMSIPESEYMYLGHHFATSFYMTSCRLMGAGHLSAMILMFTGEFTSPLMNSHLVLRFAIKLKCCSGPIVHELLAYVEYTYAVFYCIFRIFLGPIAAAHLTYDLLFTRKGRQNVHILLSLTWMPMAWGVLLGSKPWIDEAIEMLSDGLAVKYGVDYDLGEVYRHDEL